jgi:N-acetylglucosaminyldiphosphoundecaprenol N-acetyl-beta-D-mannosaminyltransferase
VDIQRIMLLKVPMDIVRPEELPDVIDHLLMPSGVPADARENKAQDIVLLSLWDLLRARRNNEYRNYVFNAALVLPISKSIVSGAKFLTGKQVVRYMPFNFIISLLSLLERREYPLYLLGGGNQGLRKAERNIHSTFPRLRIVGRRGGAIRKQDEPAVIEAIRKASPSLLMAGKGIRGEELWIAKNSGRLNSGIRLWCSDIFEVFAEKKRRPSDAVFEKGLESIGYCLRNPFKFLRILPYLRYKLLLLFYKIFRK